MNFCWEISDQHVRHACIMLAVGLNCKRARISTARTSPADCSRTALLRAGHHPIVSAANRASGCSPAPDPGAFSIVAERHVPDTGPARNRACLGQVCDGRDSRAGLLNGQQLVCRNDFDLNLPRGRPSQKAGDGRGRGTESESRTCRSPCATASFVETVKRVPRGSNGEEEHGEQAGAVV